MSEVKILFTGDFCPQLRVHELIEQKRYDLIFNDFIKEFQNSDLNIVDLECPLTEHTNTIPKTGPHLKCSPKAVEALKYAGIQAVALANNHIKDYGDRGVMDTIGQCEKAGIRTLGAGDALQSARKPLVVDIKGMRIAIINLTENEWSNTQGTEVGANPLNPINNFYDIREARKENDAVVVIYHGGNEFYELPSPRLTETLRFFIDAGASAVVAHHTHIVSGFEIYHGAPIFYSLGNFCFDWPGHRDSFWNTGFAVRLIFEKGKEVNFDILPFRQNDHRVGVHPLTASERVAFDKNISRLSEVIRNNENLTAHFKEYCESKRIIYEIYLEPYRNNLLASLYKRGFIPSFFTKSKKRLYQNIIRCESHRDVLLTLLDGKK